MRRMKSAVVCPRCHAPLDGGSVERCDACGAEFGALDGVPVLIAAARDAADRDLTRTGGALPTYDCAGMGIPSVDEALRAGGMVLELGAGLDVHDAPNVVKTDAYMYPGARLDLVADAHALPFPDASFDFVFSLAVFEHLHSPWIAAQEIARVLKPGGKAYTLCAFLQPLHGYPDHYFNATESGLARLFDDGFTIDHAGPSRHCSHRESLVPMHRMREMAAPVLHDRSAPLRTRLRAARLDRALRRAQHELFQIADTALTHPSGHAAWRQIAPAVEILATRTATA
jgi:SAM-dependent methyltransferase